MPNIFKDVKEIKTEIKEIKEIMKGNLDARAKRADELEEYLSKIEVKVKTVSEVPGPDGKTDIRVVYEVPTIIVRFDEDGNVIENDTFKAINMLNLIKDERDLMKLIKAFERKRKEI